MFRGMKIFSEINFVLLVIVEKWKCIVMLN